MVMCRVPWILNLVAWAVVLGCVVGNYTPMVGLGYPSYGPSAWNAAWPAKAGMAATLGAQHDRLIRGCTMDGASHDELHRFLEARMAGVSALGEVRPVEQAQAQVGTLRGTLGEVDRAYE